MTYPRRTRRRGAAGPAEAGALIVIAVLVIIGAAWLNSCVRNNARRDCEARGGSFITTQHSSGHYSWTCWTPPPWYRQGGDR